jgi:hypothetical protein
MKAGTQTNSTMSIEDRVVPSREDLLEHLRSVTGLDAGAVEKILLEIIHWHDEDLGAWLQRRHGELRHAGLKNPEIYPRLRDEAQGILVRPGPLSLRQIRRALYG